MGDYFLCDVLNIEEKKWKYELESGVGFNKEFGNKNYEINGLRRGIKIIV